MRIEIEVGMKAGTWQPRFTIGNQTFWLAECEDKKSAEWMAEQLKKGLKNLCFEQRKICRESVKERVDYHTPELACELSSDPLEVYGA